MAKVGFNGQWIEIARVGKVADSKGVSRDLSADWIQQVIANYAAGPHEAPAVLGHPDSDSAPAFGWAKELRLNGDVLEAKFADTNDEFEEAVRRGEYKKRSASFYLDPPNLRHIGFLGAQPPAIKGLRDIQFKAHFSGGESFAVEVLSTINFKEKDMEELNLDQLPESAWDKIKAKLGLSGRPESNTGGSESSNFSEATVEAMISKAVAKAKEEVTAEFAEKVTTLETANADLAKRLDGGEASAVKREIASFVEAFPATKGKHWLKNIGIADFLERLAIDDASDADSEKAISFSEGEGDTKVDHNFSRLEFAKNLLNSLPDVIQFGEKFGSIDASKASANPLVNSDRVASMKEAAGVAEGGK